MLTASGEHGGRRAQRNRDTEGGALSELARHMDGAPHQLSELARDGQAEARSLLILAFDLLERHENGLQRILRNAGAGVLYFKNQVVGTGMPQSKGHTSRGGEFDGVAHQIDQNLTELVRISDHGARKRVLVVGDQCDAFLFAFEIEHRLKVLKQFRQIEIDFDEVHLARFDLRNIEDVVDHAQQVVTAPIHGADILLFLIGQILALLEDLCISEHGVQRGAELVRYPREERAFRLTGFNGAFACFHKLIDAVRHQNEPLSAVVIGHGMDHPTDEPLGAVRRDKRGFRMKHIQPLAGVFETVLEGQIQLRKDFGEGQSFRDRLIGSEIIPEPSAVRQDVEMISHQHHRNRGIADE